MVRYGSRNHASRILNENVHNNIVKHNRKRKVMKTITSFICSTIWLEDSRSCLDLLRTFTHAYLIVIHDFFFFPKRFDY
jgi:hypothetical protein